MLPNTATIKTTALYLHLLPLSNTDKINTGLDNVTNTLSLPSDQCFFYLQRHICTCTIICTHKNYTNEKVKKKKEKESIK